MRYLTVFTLAVIILVSCSPKKEYLKIEGFTQGTTYSITYYDSLIRDFSVQIDSILGRIDHSMSIYNDSSIISLLNSNISDSIDDMLKEVIVSSFEIYHQSDGAFDITVGPVVRAIGFGKDKTQGIDSAKVKQLLPLIGMNKIHLDGNTLKKDDSRIQIDVNAIAQGYTVDVIGKYLESNGIKHYLVEVGGEITARGKNSKGTDWVVGIDKPVESALPGENIQAKISISNGYGLATSGNYRKFIEVNGQKYAHTINPKTGFPELNSLLSATVVAPSATKADALATAFMVKGVEWSKNFVVKSNDIDAYLVYSDSLGNYLVWMNEGMKKRIIP
ncbi:FAD:protein FMN transferase [Tenuifilum sp.]|uniref:FAD:protein FMN transferase n=1 Tax=Tenuifilum sp. TaxID=2760880 RepID=UPI001B621E3F|nr:FAD:protein FMN transferase [Bacteroidales bacterium]HOK60697.1 FAD:protein FMN transferase [Tenuifilum sp.]MBP9029083.1 FAD:protein FMN transferase [Bacteroidales bacterium]HOK84930.1 FAD:protein FMN transferase [Tenuifilum sp.]HON69804.1 FAD:protein FMN transferase [Tenuifilum sp.]